MDETEARRRLEHERDRLRELRERKAAEVAELIDPTAPNEEVADAATNLTSRETEEGVLERLDESLAEIEDALRRIDDGTYGTCSVCGEPIGDERLKERPAAARCVEHADVAA